MARGVTSRVSESGSWSGHIGNHLQPREARHEVRQAPRRQEILTGDINCLVLVIRAGGCTPKADPVSTSFRDECVFTDLKPLLGVWRQPQEEQDPRSRNFLNPKFIVMRNGQGVGDPPVLFGKLAIGRLQLYVNGERGQNRVISQHPAVFRDRRIDAGSVQMAMTPRSHRPHAPTSMHGPIRYTFYQRAQREQESPTKRWPPLSLAGERGYVSLVPEIGWGRPR